MDMINLKMNPNSNMDQTIWIQLVRVGACPELSAVGRFLPPENPVRHRVGSRLCQTQLETRAECNDYAAEHIRLFGILGLFCWVYFGVELRSEKDRSTIQKKEYYPLIIHWLLRRILNKRSTCIPVAVLFPSSVQHNVAAMDSSAHKSCSTTSWFADRWRHGDSGMRYSLYIVAGHIASAGDYLLLSEECTCLYDKRNCDY